MALSTLSTTSAPVTELEGDVLVLGVATSKDGPRLLAGEEFASLAAALPALGVTGATESILRVPALAGSAASIALVGLGTFGEDGPAVDVLRAAAGLAVRTVAGTASVALALPVASEAALGAVLEGAALGSYSFTAFRSASLAAQKTPVESVTVRVDSDVADETTTGALVEHALATAEAVTIVKDLVNTPPSHLYPESLADAVLEKSAELPLEVTVWDEQRLAEDGFGGILGVGSGSARPPRLVKVAYTPAETTEATKHLALVGKGITFDTGGLSLKPPVSMVGMKYDMTGAATVFAVVRAAARLALPVRITAWLCVAENMPSGTAMRPNDVLTIRGGRTVENLNSDAEGRLVLADGLVAASEEQPDLILDVATLTGAATVALGTRTVGVMGETAGVATVIAAAKTAGEQMWHMPIPGEVRALLNSEVADIANVKPGNTAAGMLVAAAFLRDFVGTTGEGDDERRIDWAHLDIAGVANNSGATHGFTGVGPTGVSVRTLLAVAEGISRA